ncbi:hypothetical protein [Phenylobacterium montanum]|uniref:Uncharacterized protein n=1 Tax=Phenylobacterium montanum TaxID=2823693 RepID=A0A975FZF0_9CAUL|nr:hypothetical protein [Caulobacter sp. S6]QUD88090.1 hypothetical protein KCG34_24170 [Caulobacter sp. S6]
MSSGFLVQSAASLVAVMMLIGLAAWAKIGRPCPPLDESRARSLMAEEFPDDRPASIWISADGRGAIGRAGDKALVLFRVGDAYVARTAPWSGLGAALRQGDGVRLKFGEIGAPAARFKLEASAAWPPALGEAA